jgi:E3 ubiquitin-protein ligase BRE1
MPAVESPVVSSDPGLVKMEDRKRPAADNNDSAPPLKKQATTTNGASKPHPDADMPWKDDLEVSLYSRISLRPEDRKRWCPCGHMLTGGFSR